MTALDTPPPAGRRRASDWIGHHSPQIFAVAVLSAIATGFLPVPGILILTIVRMIVTAVALAAWWKHDTSLCIVCGDLTPMDGDDAAARYRWRLRLIHWVFAGYMGTGVPWWERRLRIRTRAMPNAWLLLAGLVAAVLVFPLTHWWVNAEMTFVAVFGAAFALSFRTHRLLGPWCPQCNWGGGGGPADIVPNPDPGDRKPLPIVPC